MTNKFQIILANLIVEIHCQSLYVKQFCREYITNDAEADLSAKASGVEIEEAVQADKNINSEDAEVLCLHRIIAEQLPTFDRFLMHGAAISWNGKGYLFLAPSGTGKSTHIRLWRKAIGEGVGIINGDKPIIDVSGEVPLVCGTPWAGKEGWQKNVSMPLAAVCILRRGKTNRIEKTAPAGHIGELLQQIYRPQDAVTLSKTLSLIDTVFSKVPLYVMECTTTEEAARTAFTAMTGESTQKGTER